MNIKCVSQTSIISIDFFLADLRRKTLLPIKSSFSWRAHEGGRHGGYPLIKETLFDRNFLERARLNLSGI